MGSVDFHCYIFFVSQYPMWACFTVGSSKEILVNFLFFLFLFLVFDMGF